MAATAAAASWALTWTLQQRKDGAAARRLMQFGLDVEPRYATMEEMKEVSKHIPLIVVNSALTLTLFAESRPLQ